MNQSPLVSTAWLEEHLDDPDLRIVEVCSRSDGETYRSGHIPGAQWLYWKTSCWHESDRDFVSPEAMAKLFGGLGIGPQSTVVVYGDPVQYGTYAFWAFTMAGHVKLLLLDGGRKKWIAEKRPLSQDLPRLAAVDYPAPQAGPSSMRVGRDNVRDSLRAPKRLLVDLRSPEEYSGERVSDYSFKVDYGAERTGRIPGAKHLYFRALLNDDDTFKSPEEIRRAFETAGIAPDKYDEVVCYCRLSHRATVGWLALGQILGHRGVKIYDGSWTEWGSIVGFPIEK